MNIYLVTQNEATGYDTYDSFVCAAESARAARKTYPHRSFGGKSRWGAIGATWCSSPDKATSKLLGKAKKGARAGVILASFNAG